jgi:thymidylate synthase
MNNLDKQYQTLLQTILEFGIDKGDRTGTGTKSIFGYTIRHNMNEGFPLLTTKKMHWKSIVTELLWFLRGDTNIKFLLDYDCHIWDGDAYKNYQSKMTEWFGNETHLTKEQFIDKIKKDEDFKNKWGELGPIYGKQWRDWNGETTTELSSVKGEHGFYDYIINHIPGIDQLKNLIEELKVNPNSRRLMVSAWNVAELNQMTLPPCHYGFQCYVRDGKYLSLMWNQRSVDTFLGLPFNIASYGLLLEIIAKEVGMIPDELIGNLGDVHLYSNHIEQAKEQINRTSYILPKVEITERNWYLHHTVKEHLGEKTFSEKILSYRPDCFELVNYESHPKIKAPLSN